MEDERQKKILILRIGVIAGIVIIFFLWILNIKNIWRPIVLENNEELTKKSELTKLRQDISNQMTEINGKLSDISDKKQERENKAGSELLNNIIKEAEKLNASSTATSTNTSSPLFSATTTLPEQKQNNCPEYIDCIPSIGKTKLCQVPIGCEKITKIAY